MVSTAILEGKSPSSFHGNPYVPSGDDLCYVLAPVFGAQVESKDMSRCSGAFQE